MKPDPAASNKRAYTPKQTTQGKMATESTTVAR